MPKINQTALNRIIVPIPPPKEQRSIVIKFSQIQAILDKLEQQLGEANKAGRLTALAAVAQITGIRIEEKEKMKAPKTELVSNLRIGGSSPTSREQAPLTAILIKNNGELSAKILWSTSGLEIDAFYQQLKNEMANGWIVQPEAAYVKVVEAS
jgi:type I restriction enzyme S subunit